MRTPQRVVTHAALLVLSTLCLMLVAEAAARVYFVAKHQLGLWHLIDPFRRAARVSPQEPPQGSTIAEAGPVVYEYRAGQTYTKFDACSGRELTFVANEWKGRGRGWTPARAPGTVRIVAVGGSTTYGVNNPEDATWPVLLEEALRNRGVGAEVLNFSQPSRRLEHMVQLAGHVLEFQPDLVLYYEAANNATSHTDGYIHTHTAIDRFHRYSWLGRLLSWCYYRSVLYTLVFEKAQFVLAKGQGIVPEIAYFQTQLRRFVEAFRRHGVTPVFVLQVTEAVPAPRFEGLDFSKTGAVEAAILEAARSSGDQDGSPVGSRLWMYQTQVLVEAARRTAHTLGVQVIDPRAAFASYRGPERLFCDFVHLTDEGNTLLARAIAEQLEVPPMRR